MLSFIKRILTEPSRWQRPIDPLERFAKSGYARATTPDAIIAAAVCQSIAKDFDSWKIRSLSSSEISTIARTAGFAHALSHALQSNSGPTVAFYASSYIIRSPEAKHFIVADAPIAQEAGQQILAVYLHLQETRLEAERIAERVKREMEENEKKWNLAERLLNMKRNEQGALVPVEDVEKTVVPAGGCPPVRRVRPKRKKADNRFDHAVG